MSPPRDKSLCPVCRLSFEQNAHGSKLICNACHRSLQDAGSTQYDILEWAAKRARRFSSREALGLRRHLVALVRASQSTLSALDHAMKRGSDKERGEIVARACNFLDMAKDQARLFGLGEKL